MAPLVPHVRDALAQIVAQVTALWVAMDVGRLGMLELLVILPAVLNFQCTNNHFFQ